MLDLSFYPCKHGDGSFRIRSPSLWYCLRSMEGLGACVLWNVFFFEGRIGFLVYVRECGGVLEAAQMAPIIAGSFRFGDQFGHDLSGSGHGIFRLWSECSCLLN